MLRLDGEVFLFGTAMAGSSLIYLPVNLQARRTFQREPWDGRAKRSGEVTGNPCPFQVGFGRI
jgi:hypothetical protein